MAEGGQSRATSRAQVAIRGQWVTLQDGDLLLSQWKGWHSQLVQLITGDYSHLSLIVFIEGLPCIAESTRSDWSTVDGRDVCAGVSVRHVGKSLDDPRVLKLLVARLERPLTPQQSRDLRHYVCARAAEEPDRAASSYDCGLDFFLAPVSCGALSDDAFTCTELVARAYDAAGRWPRDESLATLPSTLQQRVGARVVQRLL
jgi:hypothetical protein